MNLLKSFSVRYVAADWVQYKTLTTLVHTTLIRINLTEDGSPDEDVDQG
jgi:hypothetical protein